MVNYVTVITSSIKRLIDCQIAAEFWNKFTKFQKYVYILL